MKNHMVLTRAYDCFYVQEDIDVQNEENHGVESFGDNISQVRSKLLDVIQ